MRAGATFPTPIYQKWFGEYKMAHPDVQINYQSIGSGGGIRQLTEGTVDFGASDMPMTDEQIKGAEGKAAALSDRAGRGRSHLQYSGRYGRSQADARSRSRASTWATSTKWNDPKIASANPGVKLPAKDIEVVHRSDGSGTTFVFTDYLSKVSPDWKTKVGANTSVQLADRSRRQRATRAYAGLVKQTPNSIGYVELVYAVQQQNDVRRCEERCREIRQSRASTA